MAFPAEHLWTFATDSVWNSPNRYFISTAKTADHGLETMVFPASKDARIHESWFNKWVEGVDFENPFEQFTRHYRTVKEAKEGHKEVVRIIQELKKTPVNIYREETDDIQET